jgi:hypothetical protein
VPHLAFPDDINVDPREKRKIHEKPVGEQRFSLKKSTGTDAKKGGYGKKAKLLDINSNDASKEGFLNESIEIDRLPAARGEPVIMAK